MQYVIEVDGEAVPVQVRALDGQRYQVRVGDAPPRVVRAAASAAGVHLLDGVRTAMVRAGAHGDDVDLWSRGRRLSARVLSPRAARLRARGRAASAGGGALVVRSPMPGRVVELLVAVGDPVEAGQGVVIVEAMKMENELRAEVAGIVEAVRCAPGDLVDGGAELVVLAAPEP